MYSGGRAAGRGREVPGCAPSARILSDEGVTHPRLAFFFFFSFLKGELRGVGCFSCFFSFFLVSFLSFILFFFFSPSPSPPPTLSASKHIASSPGAGYLPPSNYGFSQTSGRVNRPEEKPRAAGDRRSVLGFGHHLRLHQPPPEAQSQGEGTSPGAGGGRGLGRRQTSSGAKLAALRAFSTTNSAGGSAERRGEARGHRPRPTRERFRWSVLREAFGHAKYPKLCCGSGQRCAGIAELCRGRTRPPQPPGGRHPVVFFGGGLFRHVVGKV